MTGFHRPRTKTPCLAFIFIFVFYRSILSASTEMAIGFYILTSYQPATGICISSQLCRRHTPFSHSTNQTYFLPTEAEDLRQLTQHGVLSSLVGGEGWRGPDLCYRWASHSACCDVPYTVIRFLWVRSKFGTCTVVSVYGTCTLVEDKIRRLQGECAHFSFSKCHIYTHDGASANLSTNLHETDNSVLSGQVSFRQNFSFIKQFHY